MKRFLPPLVVLLLLALGLTATAEPANNPNAVYPKSLKMSRAKATLVNATGKPGTVQLNATTAPTLPQLTYPTISWLSDDASIAKVDANGLVTATGEGTTSVRATIQGKTKLLSVACRVTVKAVRATGIVLDCQDLLLLDHTDAAKRTKTIVATVSPPTATYQGVTWESSDRTVASVDDTSGKVTAHKSGTAVITATTDNGRKKTTCTVRVRDVSNLVSITISAGGDIVLGGDPVKKTDKRFDQIVQDNGFDFVLKDLKKVFEKDDLTILNMEGPLKSGTNAKNPLRQFNFSGKPEYVNILLAGSVEVANVANNHVNDFGGKAVTKRILRENGIALSDMAFSADYSVKVVKGVRVGFIGFQTPCSIGTVRTQLRKAKETCDMVVVSFHFCDVPEHTHGVRSSQTKIARAAIDAGADLVLGHHTHVTSGIERYKGKYIYYGLGSVQSSGADFKYPNMIMQQVFKVEPGKNYTESEVPTVYPIFTSGAPINEPNNCQPILLPSSDERYKTLLSIIDRNSKNKGMYAAPYNLG